MFTCGLCSKEYEKQMQLTAHVRFGHEGKNTKVSPVSVNTVEDLPKLKTDVYDTQKYKELPKPIVAHLELTFGNWLNHFEIGQEWREDYGGFGIYIRIPRQYSVEWKDIKTPKYDNATRRLTGETVKTVEDYRSKPLKEIPEVISWINLVKENVIVNAYRKGLRLPNTMTGIDETKQTLDQYERSLAQKIA